MNWMFRHDRVRRFPMLAAAAMVAIAAHASPAKAADWGIQNCSNAQKAAVVNARQDAFRWMDKLVQAMPYVKNQKNPPAATFNLYMGATNANSALMSGAFNSIKGYLDNPKIVADCTVTPACAANPAWIAYVETGVGPTPMVVHLCAPFFGLARNVQTNTLIHELAHRANNLIIDQVMPPGAPGAGGGAYSPAAVQWLAANTSDLSIKNAESYSLLAENMFPVKLP